MKISSIIKRSYSVRIFVGTQDGYSGNFTPVEYIKSRLQEFMDNAGGCVTVTETEFIYTGGNEKGVIIEIINYPRFGTSRKKLWKVAEVIASNLMIELNQYRVSMQDHRKVMMLCNDEKIKKSLVG